MFHAEDGCATVSADSYTILIGTISEYESGTVSRTVIVDKCVAWKALNMVRREGKSRRHSL